MNPIAAAWNGIKTTVVLYCVICTAIQTNHFIDGGIKLWGQAQQVSANLQNLQKISELTNSNQPK